MVYDYEFDGLRVQTGDILCTTNGAEGVFSSAFWQMFGCVVPGHVDHVAVYVGPGGRCVESGPLGVLAFEMPERRWDSVALHEVRWFADTLYGVAYPLVDRDLPTEREQAIRAQVGAYCLAQATARKPYNLNYLDPHTEKAFYCSQLPYKAYLPHGVDFNTGKGVPEVALVSGIIFPQEIWESCYGRRTAEVVQLDTVPVPSLSLSVGRS